MKSLKTSGRIIGLFLIFSLVLINCKPKAEQKEPIDEVKSDAVVHVVSEGMDIQMPDTLTAGWHTFKFHNKSPDEHFILFDKYPEGKNIHDSEKEVAPAFQKGMDLIMQGDMDAAMAAFGELPAWFSEIVFTGGTGLISPGLTAETTMKLEPGTYAVECYVKMPNGMFHTSMGMIVPLIVTEEVSDGTEPEANVTINVSGETGFTVTGSFVKGEQIAKVYFEDQKAHENFVGHDVNLVKVEDGVDITILETWINWSIPDGLVSPGPEGFTFLGGVNDMPAGSTGYFKVNLEPGNYVLIAEVPNTSQKNLLTGFQIAK